MHMVPNAHWARHFLAVLHLRPSRLAIIVSPWEFGLALTSYRTHRRTSNLPTDGANCRSRFSNWAHYNEFVESVAKSWALMRRRLVLGMKGIQNQAAQRPREKGPLTRGWEYTNPSRSCRSLPLVSGPPISLGGLCCYLFLSSVHPPPTLVSHPCLSLSAYPLSHSFWRSVSCCGPHRLVQGSHPH